MTTTRRTSPTKRACDSCLRQAATRRVKVKGVTFLVCSGCAPATKRSAA